MAINKPVGRVSVKPTPVNAVAVLGLVSVKVRALFVPCAIVVGEKAFESVGTTGRGQPVMVMPSRYIVAEVAEGLPEYCPPAA